MGGQGGHVPPQVLGYRLTLFGPRGADYARHITTGPPMLLEDAASLLIATNARLYVHSYRQQSLGEASCFSNRDSFKRITKSS